MKTAKSEQNRKEDYVLISKAQSGDVAARNTLVVKYRAWCKRQAMIYAPRFLKNDFDDTLQNVYIALINAIDRFDMSRGVALTTIAKWSVCSLMHNAKEYDYTVRVPRNSRQTEDGDRATRMLSLDIPTRKERRVFQELLAHESGDDVAPEYPEAIVEQVRTAIAKLPESVSVVLTMRMDGVSLLEISRRLGIKRRRAQTLECQAMRHIKELLTQTDRQSN